MPFGIIDTRPSAGEELPGTELLIDDERTGIVPAVDTSRLKRVVVNGVDTILIPQPSDNDPNDPLLWPKWKKELTFWVVFVNLVIFAIVPGPILAPSTFALAAILGVPLSDIALLSGYMVLVVGCIGPLVSVLAQKYGKRNQFLFSAVAGTIGTIVCCVGANGHPNYHTLLAGRIVQGLGTTAWESLAMSAIGDMYYLHERGWRTSLLVCALSCIVCIVSIVSGVMTENVGWQNLFNACLPFNIVGLFTTVFLLPETQFRRKTVDVFPTPATHSPRHASGDEKSNGEIKHTETTREERMAVQKKTYLQELVPFSGTYTNRNLLHLLSEIFMHLINPAVFWILLVSGVFLSLFVVSAYITSQIWSVPPYNLNVAQNGYFYAGALIGGILAIFAGPMCDWTARVLSRMNNGVFEAEFRIPINILAALGTALGWFLFMWDVNHPTPNGYYLGAFCHGLVCFGISVSSTSAGLYILDSFPRQATEVFVLQMMLKNFLFYGFSTFINTWAAEKGAGDVFRVFGIVSVALLATSIPMYIFGKMNRRVMHRLFNKSKIFRTLG
ncbi:major facilitator superfamily domain-containing protein [Diplogelasinospora grovesii]|uniref:Major facilitator superfamily domain-containing protein n=1 Tax=Diplogelasinospora grovesii TaxID=303347 RepID=A0AAN6N429_9PEZI|nr:major facilitator superfamily domain-containing protein [Diplogelasinospora grovesii]